MPTTTHCDTTRMRRHFPRVRGRADSTHRGLRRKRWNSIADAKCANGSGLRHPQRRGSPERGCTLLSLEVAMNVFAFHQRHLGRWVLSLLLPTAMLSGGDAAADAVTPVVITMLGPGTVRIRIALGSTFPCDSGDNRRLIEGKYGPGEVVRTSTPDRCVCLQQTYEPFTDIEWSAPLTVCRPQICTRSGRGKKCVPAPDPTIRFGIHSKRPF